MKKIDNNIIIFPLQGLRMILFSSIFLFHTSAFEGVSESVLYKWLLQGNGALAVCYFFVLSGFVFGFSNKEDKLDTFRKWVIWIFGRYKNWFLINLVYLLFAIPFDVLHIKEKIPALVLNLFLLQSWVPDSLVLLSFNSVSWFLSALVFMTVMTPIIVWISRRIQEHYFIAIVICILIIGFLTIICILGNIESKFILYSFPPVRLFDYTAGYFLGRWVLSSYKHKTEMVNFDNSWSEALIVVIYILYLVIYQFLPIELTKSFIFVPGALLTIIVLKNGNGIITKILGSTILVKDGGQHYFL